jgi:hypothetical protein
MRKRILICWAFLLVLLVAPVAFATQACEGVGRQQTADQRAALAPVLARQLNVPAVTVLASFRVDAWLGVYVDTLQSDEVFLFFSADPPTVSYSSVWSGAAKRDEELALKTWAMKNNPGIPSALAACFAWFVTSGR